MTIGFGPNAPWGAVSQVEYRRKAKDARHALAYRAWFAALGHANRIGHAEFAPGALAELLGTDGRPVTRQGARDAIARAKDRDLLHRDSGLRCLVLAAHQFQKEGHGSLSCGWHGLQGVRAA